MPPSLMYNVKEINVPKSPDRALYFFPKAKGLLTGSYKETLAVTVHPPLSKRYQQPFDPGDSCHFWQNKK